MFRWVAEVYQAGIDNAGAAALMPRCRETGGYSGRATAGPAESTGKSGERLS